MFFFIYKNDYTLSLSHYLRKMNGKRARFSSNSLPKPKKMAQRAIIFGRGPCWLKIFEK